MESLDWKWLFDETYVDGNLRARPLGYLVTIKRDGKTARGLDWYLEDATLAAVINMERGTEEAGEPIPKAKEVVRPKPAKQDPVVAEQKHGSFGRAKGIVVFACGIIVGALAIWLLRR